MRVVLGTNVLVSGLLSPHGPASQLVLMTSAGDIVVCHDSRVLHEYRTVLIRPRFRFPRGQVKALLTQIESEGEFVAASPLTLDLPDPSDRPFIEVAVAAVADALITGNRRHYPSGVAGVVPVLSPSEALAMLATRRL
ncbi:MAG: putative toxin-antitoxin system toxin component, PIN family [Armatimonadetes bacterium]|nr:putative toxin-antitoxin system toxin component, PIN family [Armatimonadota bacterium]